MNQLLTLLKWDIILFNRNKLILLAAIVLAIYTGVFYLLKPFGNLTTLVIILIFNDPIVTAYLFAGILLLFDKNQHTLQAISVLPMSLGKYLFSKIFLLSSLATLASLILAFVTKGSGFSFIHLVCASFLSAFIFSCFGFAIASVSKTFNHLLLYSIPFFLISGIPFLSMFGYGTAEYFFFIPSTGGIGLLEASFDGKPPLIIFFLYSHLTTWAWLSWRIAIKVTLKALL